MQRMFVDRSFFDRNIKIHAKGSSSYALHVYLFIPIFLAEALYSRGLT